MSPSASAEELESDETLVRVGPLGSELMDALNRGDVTMERKLHVFFRYRVVRLAFEKHQFRLCQQRAAGYALAYWAYQTLGFLLRVVDSSIDAGSALTLLADAPHWISVVIIAYLAFCSALLYALPTFGRLAPRRLGWLSSVRGCDAVLALSFAGYLALVPRLHGESDAFGLRQQVEESPDKFIAPPAEALFHTVSLVLVIAGGGTCPSLHPAHCEG